jgi:hypothetical protein
MKLVSDYIIAQHKTNVDPAAAKAATTASATTGGVSSGSSHGSAQNESGVAVVKKSFENSAGGKGTGGTDLMTFLKPIRDHCTKSVIVGGNSGDQRSTQPVGVAAGVSYLKSNADKDDLDLYVKPENS